MSTSTDHGACARLACSYETRSCVKRPGSDAALRRALSSCQFSVLPIGLGYACPCTKPKLMDCSNEAFVREETRVGRSLQARIELLPVIHAAQGAVVRLSLHQCEGR